METRQNRTSAFFSGIQLPFFWNPFASVMRDIGLPHQGGGRIHWMTGTVMKIDHQAAVWGGGVEEASKSIDSRL